MTLRTLLARLARWGVRIVVLLAFAAGVVLLMLWLAGKFSPKVPESAAAHVAAGGRCPRAAGDRAARSIAAYRIGRGHDPRRA